jgi:hypothetical protein
MRTHVLNHVLNHAFCLFAVGSVLCAAGSKRVVAGEPPSPAARAVADLSRELGTSIELRGGMGRMVALPSSVLPAEERVANLSAGLTGTWRRVLRVAEKPAAKALDAVVLDRSITLGFSDLPASKAFAIAARQLAADLDPATAPDRRVTLPGVARTTRELLDEIARQAGVSWTLEYRIDAPDAEVTRMLTQPEPRRPAVPTPGPEVLAPPMPVNLSPTAWSRGLRESVQKLLKAPPDKRSAALETFLCEAGDAAVVFRAVPAERRGDYRSASSRLFDQWTRLYQGLAPSVRDQLDPADAVMRELLGR